MVVSSVLTLCSNALNEGPAIADEASREKGCVCRFNLAKDGETAVPCQYIITGGKDMNRNYEEHLANMHSDILITKQEDGVAACYAICKYVKPDGKVCDTEDLRGTLGLRPYYDVVRHTLRVTKKHM